MSTNDILPSMGSHPEVTCSYLDPERILRSGTLDEGWAGTEFPSKGKMEATSTSAWEKILNSKKSVDANCHREAVEKQQVKLGSAPEGERSLIATVLQEVVADNVKRKVAIVLEAIPDTGEAAFEQLSRAATFIP